MSKLSETTRNTNHTPRTLPVLYGLLLLLLLRLSLDTAHMMELPISRAITETFNTLSNNNTDANASHDMAIAVSGSKRPERRPAHWYCLCSSVNDPSCNTHGYCDTIFTYKEEHLDRNDTHYVPSSTWGTARNGMYFLSRRRREYWERRGLPVESHYCFLDGDTRIGNRAGGKDQLNQRLINETETDKVIAFNYRRAYDGPTKYIYNADANAHCYSVETIDDFFPLNTNLDHMAWSLAPADMTIRHNIKNPFLFKIYQEIIVRNPVHGEYPRNETLMKQAGDKMIQRLQEEGYSAGCVCRRSSPSLNCSWNGQLLHDLPINRSHHCGYWDSTGRR